jgi:hypothetical protein
VIVLDVTIVGRTVVTSADGTVIGGATGETSHHVGWDGEWLTDGDPATLTAQRNEVIALFPSIQVEEITITPAPADPEPTPA